MSLLTLPSPQHGLRFALLSAALAIGSHAASAQSLTYSTPYAVTTLAGKALIGDYLDGTGSGAYFNSPYGVAVDGAGNVYVADSANFVIRKVTSAGVVTTFAGSHGVNGVGDGVGTGAQFGAIQGIAIDSGGANLYVTDYTHNSIRKIVVASGAVSTITLTGGTLNHPQGIAVDAAGNLYVADWANAVIRKVSPAGAMTTLAGTVGNTGGNDGTGAAAQFSAPTGVAVDGAGNVYVADSGGNTIRKVTAAGVVTTIAGLFGYPGSVDGAAAGAAFSHPFGLALDGSGNLFITDDSSLVREMTAGGTVSTLAGTTIQGRLDGTGNNAGLYNPTGIAVSSSGVLYIADTSNCTIRKATAVAANQPPTIQFQPAATTTTSIGSNVTLQVTAAGTAPLSYQWQFGGTNVFAANASGATTSTLTITSITASQGGSYTVIITNAYGTITSAPAVVTVSGAGATPTFTTQPASQTASAGTTVNLASAATGATSYQWRLNGTAIAGATASSLALANIGTTQAGTYDVVASNSLGSTLSNPAVVTVNVNANLVNLSARAFVGTNSQVLVAGFAIGGSASTKHVLIRGDGPTLSQFSVSGVLANPVLTLFDTSGATIATDTGWANAPVRGSSSLQSTTIQASTTADFNQVYAFLLPANSADSSMTTILPPGTFTAQVNGTNSTTGVALAELYDADTGTPSSHLINISARAFVGTGLQVLVAGFNISGSTSQTVLIRAAGPTLSQYGISGPLAAPQLDLYDSSGKIIATNTAWASASTAGNSSVSAGVLPATTATFDHVGAFHLQNATDCAMLVTLPPGSYTAQVSGVGSTTGVSLVEVYDVR